MDVDQNLLQRPVMVHPSTSVASNQPESAVLAVALLQGLKQLLKGLGCKPLLASSCDNWCVTVCCCLSLVLYTRSTWGSSQPVRCCCTACCQHTASQLADFEPCPAGKPITLQRECLFERTYVMTALPIGKALPSKYHFV